MKTDDAKKIISTVIDREFETCTFYRTIADTVNDKNLKDLFAEPAGEEKKHREFLLVFLTKDVKPITFAAGHDYTVGDGLPSPKLTTDLKPLDGMILAIRKELGHAEVYPVCQRIG